MGAADPSWAGTLVMVVSAFTGLLIVGYGLGLLPRRD